MRVGTVCYATEQGIGYLAKSFFDAGIVTDVIIMKYPKGKVNHREWYPEGTPFVYSRTIPETIAGKFIKDIDVLLCFENPLDWSFPDKCRERGIKTVMIPMHEWFPTNPRHKFDAFICPSELDVEYFPDSKFIPIPVDVPWELRIEARRFLHNGGNLGCREHKGTRQLLQAIPLIKSDAEITIRAQNGSGLSKMIHDVYKGVIPNRLKIELGERPYEDLWTGYDVVVVPEKFNGLSLPLQEARAAGLLVITTDRYPANTWLPKDPLIRVNSESRQVVAGGYLNFIESELRPEDIAAKIDEWYGRDISDYSLAGKYWAEEMSWDVLKPIYLEELERICHS